MASTWTSDQVLALAPDPASAKAGRDLATPRKWVTLGANDSAVWGECQGSGAKPYQTQIDLSEPAFKCSCPSRKFPCKHGLGLFLILASQPAELQTNQPPAWVSEWLASRAARAEKKTAKAEGAESKAPDPEAQAKRAAAREEKVRNGLEEVGLWLRDLVRRGLATAQSQPNSFWETPASRLVDAQATGVARMVQNLAGIPPSGEGWPGRMLSALGRIHLLIQGFERLDGLPPETQADIRTAIGWAQKQEEVLALPGETDRWLVLGQRVEDEDRLRVQRTWLWGINQARPALILNFSAMGQPLDVSYVPGSVFEAELVYYPSAAPLRALLKKRESARGVSGELPGHSGIAAANQAHAEAVSSNPWLERLPLPLLNIVPINQDGHWALRDRDGHTLPLHPRFSEPWALRSVSGGGPIWISGEWDGQYFLPLSLWQGRFVIL